MWVKALEDKIPPLPWWERPEGRLLFLGDMGPTLWEKIRALFRRVHKQ